MGTGIFEQCHFLMGFEPTLTNLYEHPDEMHELIEYITEYRLRYVKNAHRQFAAGRHILTRRLGHEGCAVHEAGYVARVFQEPYRRFYGYIRSRGCIAVHHADSYLVPIVDDMAEIGIQVWQGTLPENDIPALQRHLKKLVLMGGMGPPRSTGRI